MDIEVLEVRVSFEVESLQARSGQIDIHIDQPIPLQVDVDNPRIDHRISFYPMVIPCQERLVSEFEILDVLATSFDFHLHRIGELLPDRRETNGKISRRMVEKLWARTELKYR
jgi:hypothetical protein